MNDFDKHYIRVIKWTFFITLLIAFLKSIRIPDAYARAHFFFTYNQGLVKRGLIGTIFQFLFGSESPQTKNNIIFYFSLFIIVAFLTLTWLLCNLIVKKNPRNYYLHLCLIAFTLCPALIFTIHLIGFFDNIFFLFTLISVYVIIKDFRYSIYIVAIISLVSMFIHEIYLFVSLPTICFAIAFKKINTSTTLDELFNTLIVVIVPCIIALIILSVFHNSFDEHARLLFMDDFNRNRVVGLNENGTIFYSHFVSFSDNIKFIESSWRDRPLDYTLKAAVEFLPTSFLFCFFCINSMIRLNIKAISKAILISLCIVVVFAPLILHFIAWDYERITGFTSITGFFCLVVVGLNNQEQSTSFAFKNILIPLSIIGLNISMDFPLYSGYRIRYFPEILFSLKDEINNLKLANNYIKPEKPLFPNSDFEDGDLRNWTPYGEAMKYQPTFGDNALLRGRYVTPQGDWWIGTVEDNHQKDIIAGKLAGDEVKGKLTSCKFIIKQNKITFLIGGGSNIQNTYVAFYVDGTEIGRFTGENNELMKQQTIDVSNYMNKEAWIEIVDDSPDGWGHINVDDFGYLK